MSLKPKWPTEQSCRVWSDFVGLPKLCRISLPSLREGRRLTDGEGLFQEVDYDSSSPLKPSPSPRLRLSQRESNMIVHPVHLSLIHI